MMVGQMQTVKLLMELIDTLWNVNNSCLQMLRQMLLELIDTLWNVNANVMEDIFTNTDSN